LVAVAEIERCEWSETEDSKEWDDFVAQNGGSIFHTWPWRRVIERNDARPLYLACRDSGGKVIAVCPFLYTAGRHLLYLESLPDSHMAGPVMSGQAMDISKVISSLPKSVRFSPFNPVIAMKVRVHQQRIIQQMIALGFQYEVKDGLFILDLHEKTLEHIWNNGFSKHDRQAVKYHERLGSVFEFAKSEGDYIDYLTLQKGSTRRRKYRADFLSKMRLSMGDRLKVAVATLEGKVIAGFPMLCDPVNSMIHLAVWVTVAPYTGAIRRSAVKNIHSPVIFVNWKTINWAYEHGFRYVSFGGDRASSSPKSPFHVLTERFEATFVPAYRFTLPTSRLSYSIAKGIAQVRLGLNQGSARA
jgi:hypothetical protein